MQLLYHQYWHGKVCSLFKRLKSLRTARACTLLLFVITESELALMFIYVLPLRSLSNTTTHLVLLHKMICDIFQTFSNLILFICFVKISRTSLFSYKKNITILSLQRYWKTLVTISTWFYSWHLNVRWQWFQLLSNFSYIAHAFMRVLHRYKRINLQTRIDSKFVLHWK